MLNEERERERERRGKIIEFKSPSTKESKKIELDFEAGVVMTPRLYMRTLYCLRLSLNSSKKWEISKRERERREREIATNSFTYVCYVGYLSTVT